MSQHSPSRRGVLFGGAAAAIPIGAAVAAPTRPQDLSPEFASVLKAYQIADTASDSASVALDDAADRYQAMGGTPPRPPALTFREEDCEFRIDNLALYGRNDEARSYGESSVRHLQAVPRIRRIEQERPGTLADGFTQEEIDCGGVIKSATKAPWPEAQARGEEIVAAWHGWKAEIQRRQHASGLSAAEAAEDVAGEAAREAARELVECPARTLGDVREKVSIVLEIHDNDPHSIMRSFMTNTTRDEMLMASIVRDLALLGAKPGRQA